MKTTTEQSIHKHRSNHLREDWIKDIIRKIIETMSFQGTVPEKNLQIMEKVLLEGKTTEETGEELALSGSRIGQLFHLTQRILSRSIRKTGAIMDENQILRTQNAGLKEQIALLIGENTQLSKKLNVPRKEIVIDVRHVVLQMPIEKLNLSLRVNNTLRRHECKTINDILVYDEYKMLRWKNFGKRGITELKQALEDMGLELA